MAKKALDPFVTYYQHELLYLRAASTSFAIEHPKIARRLELGQGESADPHIERLLESFAYLTAGLQREIDDKFPRISTALLGILYPQFTSPLPAMTVAYFQIQAKKGKLTASIDVPKNSPLFAKSSEGPVCNFRTSYDLTLWPIQVTQSEIIPVDTLDFTLQYVNTSRVLRIRIESMTEPLSSFDIKSLRFYINGERPTQNAIYEMLFTEDAVVHTLPDTHNHPSVSHVDIFPSGQVSPVGFSSEELVLPFNEPSHPAYTLLYEYFNFPNKFMFFDVQGFNLKEADKYCDIFISIPDTIKSSNLTINENNFLLNCTPIINLYTKISEPLRLDYRSSEYQLAPDYRKERTTEIHSISEVYSVVGETGKEVIVAPYFSYNHYESNRNAQTFWVSRRIPTTIADAIGTDMMISFVDYNFNPANVNEETVYARLLCTNRSLADSLAAGSVLEIEGGIPVQITCLEKPTKQYYPPTDGDTQWRLISQLAVNHISLIAGKNGTSALKELLELYDNLTEIKFTEEIDSITSIEAKEVARQIRRQDWRGFASGVHIDLTMNSKALGIGGGFLFAAVLNEFFALYSTINSFIELSLKIKDQQGEWKRWKPHLGDKFLI